MKIHRDLRKDIKMLKKSGWFVMQDGRHVKIYSPDGSLRVTISTTLGDTRCGLSNIRADIKKARRSYERGGEMAAGN